MKNLSISPKEILLELASDVAGSVLFAAGIYTFISCADFAPGGVSGIALLINHFTRLPIGAVSLALNIPIVLFSFRYLSRSFFLRSLKTMLISAFFMDIVFPLFPVYRGEKLLAALFGGIFIGAGLAVVFLRGSSTGGVDFLVFSFKKLKPHLSFGQISLAIDALVILAGAVVFRKADAALYGLIATVVSNITLDRIIGGSSVGKMAFIITDYPNETARAISDAVERGSTIFTGTGSFTGERRTMVLCACGKAEIVKVRRAAHETDPNSLIMITDYTEAFGEGFQDAAHL
ncbi:MAG: YitT family protein [Oscillospiraceae bacterium]|nr:YitT family protein [Oscillospiraceae bacterium]